MIEIIGVRFKDVGKIYYFAPNGNKLPVDSVVIVETAKGVESGTVVLPNRMVEDKELHLPLKEIIRVATEEDKEKIKKNRLKEKEVLKLFTEKIQYHKLDMKPIGIDCTFDGNKLLFYFTSDNRVDFRELVKDLAAIYRTRIELRQIGVRDEAKLLGGLGICGRAFCCKTFLGEFQPVSIKMAKEQSLSLNPVKISGTCGRLMCCLKYEQDCYEELLAMTPKQSAYVLTEEGKGHVEEVNLLTGILKVKLDKDTDGSNHTVHRDQVKIIKDAHIRLNREEIMALKSLEDN